MINGSCPQLRGGPVRCSSGLGGAGGSGGCGKWGSGRVRVPLVAANGPLVLKEQVLRRAWGICMVG